MCVCVCVWFVILGTRLAPLPPLRPNESYCQNLLKGF